MQSGIWLSAICSQQGVGNPEYLSVVVPGDLLSHEVLQLLVLMQHGLIQPQSILLV